MCDQLGDSQGGAFGHELAKKLYSIKADNHSAIASLQAEFMSLNHNLKSLVLQELGSIKAGQGLLDKVAHNWPEELKEVRR